MKCGRPPSLMKIRPFNVIMRKDLRVGVERKPTTPPQHTEAYHCLSHPLSSCYFPTRLDRDLDRQSIHPTMLGARRGPARGKNNKLQQKRAI